MAIQTASRHDIILAPPTEAVALPPDRNPASVYISTLASGSKRTMTHALETIARLVDPTLMATTLPWHRLQHQHVVAIRARLAEKFAPSNTNKMMSALKGTLRAAFNLQLMTGDDFMRATNVKAVRGSRVPKGRALNQGELRALFGVCDSTTPTGARNAALMAILYAGGLRRSEVVDLDLDDFDRGTGRLRVHGKGGKERTVYINNGALRAVDAWLLHRGVHAGPLLHPLRKGGAILRRRMDDQSVLDLVRRLATKAGVARFSPHDVRRTTVGDLLDLGVDLSTVQQLAGHSDPKTSASYDRRGERTKRAASEMLHVPFVG
jgi:site-specific recombinase XerD